MSLVNIWFPNLTKLLCIADGQCVEQYMMREKKHIDKGMQGRRYRHAILDLSRMFLEWNVNFRTVIGRIKMWIVVLCVLIYFLKLSTLFRGVVSQLRACSFRRGFHHSADTEFSVCAVLSPFFRWYSLRSERLICNWL